MRKTTNSNVPPKRKPFSKRPSLSRPQLWQPQSPFAHSQPRRPQPFMQSQRRHSFSARVANVSCQGEKTLAARLRSAFTKPPVPVSERFSSESEALLSTHLFHSYAARMDPMVVRSLLKEISQGQVVLDPFVGSGTTLVETSLLGAQGIGVDISPLSVMLTKFKATPMPESMRTSLATQAQAICQRSLERVQARKKPRLNWDEQAYYEPHVYLELCGLREEIEPLKSKDRPLYEALLLIFSSLVIKASRQTSESRGELRTKTIGPGQFTKWFWKRTEEVLRLHKEFSAKVPPQTPKSRVFQGDAREIVHWEKEIPSSSVDIICTSPPYLGIYNYAEHQRRRAAWLLLDDSKMQASEMASRRENAEAPLEALKQRYLDDTTRWIQGAARVLKPGGVAYIVVGDSWLQKSSVRGDEPILKAAALGGLRFLASCSAEFVDTSSEVLGQTYTRKEHLIQLQK